jgi:serralysin
MPAIQFPIAQFAAEMARFSSSAYLDHSFTTGTLVDGRGKTQVAPLTAGWEPLSNLAVSLGTFADGTFVSADQRAWAHAYQGSVNGVATLVIAFRGADDYVPDIADFVLSNHYARLSPFLSAIDSYIAAQRIGAVYVTGHSLGGAMAQRFMDSHANDARFLGATFGSPGTSSADNSDSRIVHYEHAGDPVPGLARLLDARNQISGEQFVIDRVDNGFTLSGEHRISMYVESLGVLAEGGVNLNPPGFSRVEWNVHVGGSSGENINPLQFRDPELLVGRGGNDVITGGGQGDVLLGGEGDDTLAGGAGNDRLVGGSGSDTAGFSGAIGNYSFGQSRAIVVVNGPDGNDALQEIEFLSFGSSAPVAVSSLASSVVMRPLVSVTRDGVATYEIATPFSGPRISGIQIDYQFLGAATGEIASGTDSNDFLNLLGGDDAADGGEGADILDGGIGSNFLQGNSGTDSFFLDGRGGSVTWSTITDWQAGEQLSVWGWRAESKVIVWRQDGAAGFQGITMHADLNNDGTIDTSVTWAGKTQAELPTPGQYPAQELLWFT